MTKKKTAKRNCSHPSWIFLLYGREFFERCWLSRRCRSYFPAKKENRMKINRSTRTLSHVRRIRSHPHHYSRHFTRCTVCSVYGLAVFSLCAISCTCPPCCMLYVYRVHCYSSWSWKWWCWEGNKWEREKPCFEVDRRKTFVQENNKLLLYGIWYLLCTILKKKKN